MSNYKTILFDLDGTLVDTAPDIAIALNAALIQAKLTPVDYEVIRPVVSNGSKALVTLGSELQPEDEGFDQVQSFFLNHYSKALANDSQLFTGMEKVLGDIESHNLSWGVVTNKPAYLTDPLMKALNLYSRAACIVSGDTTPERKPHPGPLYHAAKLANSAPSECLYIGDARRDIEAGKRASMTTLIASFGYIGSWEQPETWGADGMVSNALEILDWL